MSVYVDAPREYAAEVRGYVGRARARHRWCHMIADTVEELHAMADRLGLRREWFQGDHYDIVPAKRTLAIKLGAVATDRRTFVNALRRFRGQPPILAPSTVGHDGETRPEPVTPKAQRASEGVERVVLFAEKWRWFLKDGDKYHEAFLADVAVLRAAATASPGAAACNPDTGMT